MPSDLPFSQACENNKQPILEHLQNVFIEPGLVLEIGTGTGQHAVHFASHMPHLKWLPSDHPNNAELSHMRLAQAQLDNVLPPVVLDVSREPWPIDYVDGVFSANTAHIMGWLEVEAMFRGVARRLKAGATFCLYGPFNYDGQYSSDSNRRFDLHLKQQAPQMGIRDLGDLENLGMNVGLELESDNEMPANNRLLVWRRA
jgi:cyclopropane fatty-acyl-phospholipid synthase-like methyltransferase